MNNSRWRTAQCFKSKYLVNEARYEKAVNMIFYEALLNETN